MKRYDSRTRQESTRRQKAGPRRYAGRSKQDGAPASRGSRTFDASIQILADETESLSAVVREWLVRGIHAVVQAVKRQSSDDAVPPERQLPPPKRAGGDDRDPHTLRGVSRRRQP